MTATNFYFYLRNKCSVRIIRPSQNSVKGLHGKTSKFSEGVSWKATCTVSMSGNNRHVITWNSSMIWTTSFANFMKHFYKHFHLSLLRHHKVCNWDVTILFMGFPDSSVGKESACIAGDPSSIPGMQRSTGEGIGYPLQYSWASLVAQLGKNAPAMLETWVQSLGWEDPLENGKATHSGILAWRIPWTV